MPGDQVFPHPRFEHDRHAVCPFCESGDHWVAGLIDAWAWTRRGGHIADVCPDPSAAVVEGVLLLDAESNALEVQRLKDDTDRRKG